MHRFFLTPERALAETLTLSAEESHHAANVLRVRVGELVTLLDGFGTEYRGVIEHLAKRAVTVRVRERVLHSARPVELCLAIALLKGRAWDAVLEKATELGATSIQPLEAERSIVRLRVGEAAMKLVGWRAMTVAAAKQCGTPWLPNLLSPSPPVEWLTSLGPTLPAPELLLVASLESGAGSIRTAVAEFVARRGRRPISAAVVVGPEGDFTAAEYAAFRGAGAVPFTLGPLVLRADTAVVAALAVTGAELSGGA